MTPNPIEGRDPGGGAPSGAAAGPSFRAAGVATEEAPRGFLPGVLRFFFVPLLLVGASLAVFAGLGALVAHGPPGPGELVRQIAEGGKNSRWQAAQDLSNQVARGDLDLRRDDRLAGSLAEAFRRARAERDDPRVIQHLAVLLGRADPAVGAPALREALTDSDPDVRVYVVAALAEGGGPAEAEAVRARLEDLDPAVRAVAAYSAAVLAGRISPACVETTRASLAKALRDPSVEVRWNAALGLARLDDPAGADLIWKMLHRDYVRANLRGAEGPALAGFLGTGGADPRTPEQIEDAAVRNALSAVWRLRDRSMIEGVRALASSDRSPAVQDWAIRARDLLEREMAERGPVPARTWTAAEAAR